MSACDRLWMKFALSALERADVDSAKAALVGGLAQLPEPDAPKAAAPAPHQLLNRDGLAAFLGISVRQVDNLNRRELIPSLQIGKSRRFDPAQVLAALAATKGEPVHAVDPIAEEARAFVRRAPSLRIVSEKASGT